CLWSAQTHPVKSRAPVVRKKTGGTHRPARELYRKFGLLLAGKQATVMRIAARRRTAVIRMPAPARASVATARHLLLRVLRYHPAQGALLMVRRALLHTEGS